VKTVSKYFVKKLNQNKIEDYLQWKKLLKNALGGTIFHDPDFLSYHNKKFSEYLHQKIL